MASSDVRDVLNLPDGQSGARPAKKQKIAGFRPNLKGLAREVHNLGGDNPIAIVPEASQFKKRRLASRKPAARWELREFKNSGREDTSLILRHWRRKDIKAPVFHPEQQRQLPQPQREQQQQHIAQPSVEGADGTAVQLEDTQTSTEQQTQEKDGEHQHEREPTTTAPFVDEIEDSAFAKFNVRVSVPQYSDDQYQVSLQSDEWTKEETDYLMGLAVDFDLRWPIIWDRYEWNPPATNGADDVDGDESKAVVPASRPRSMEDLKARYYEVAAKVMAAQKPVQYMTQAEYALHEIMAHFNPKQEKVRKEFAMNTLSRSREEAREEESLLLEIKRILARSDRFNEERRELYNRLDYPRAETDISSFKSSAGLQTLLQNLMNADKTKKRKSLMGGADAAGGAQNGAAPSNDGKRDVGGAAAASNAATRESTGAISTPTAAGKKGQAPDKPVATPERRKLDGREEAVYGISHHDRLTSGPTFRTEKINKLFSHKSNQQQLRITNMLNELDVPNKLAMPTSATTLQYEQLLVAVNSLLEARKVSDKLDQELMIENAKKAQQKKDYYAAHPDEKPQEEEEEQAVMKPDGESGAGNSAETDNVEAPKSSDQGVETNREASGNGDGATARAAGEGEEGTKEPDAEAEAGVRAAEEAKQDAEQSNQSGREKSARPGSSSGLHKRSASVLSSVSDKSAKRQKK